METTKNKSVGTSYFTLQHNLFWTDYVNIAQAKVCHKQKKVEKGSKKIALGMTLCSNIPIKLCSSSNAIIQSFKLNVKPIKAYTLNTCKMTCINSLIVI